MAGAPIGETLRQIGRLYGGGAVAGQDDAALLRRFVAARDEEAFAGLVARHGPMVLAVCQGALRDPADVEDAFQATFLVLVRRAGTLWVNESLGGWLYRVARRVARRADSESWRREARERRGVAMDEFAGRDEGPSGRPAAALHDEIARLPEGLRRAVVLCELEGLTQAEAARQLRCGEATLRRRLAAARDRLRSRLEGQGATSASIAALLKPAIVPTGWAEATVRAALASGRPASRAAALAASVAASMALARRLRVATIVVAGMASAWGVAAAQQGKPEAPKPAQAPPAKAEAPATPKWAHLTSDAGFESWVRLEDGRSLWKSEDYAGVHDPASATELTYRGNGPIERRPDVVGEYQDGTGKLGFALDRAGVGPIAPAEIRRRMTPEGRRIEGGNFLSEAQVVDLDGRPHLRIDMSRPDSLGKLRLAEQTWYDLATGRPVRRREILQLADQEKYKREYRTTTIAYVDGGPADLHALGVPDGTPVVDDSTLNKVDIPPALQRAFDGAARAIERLPRSCRIVEDNKYGLQLAYWSAPEGYLAAWAAFVRNHNDTGLYSAGTPRWFSADLQGPGGPLDPREGLNPDRSDFPADAIAAWLPLDKSTNVRLNDGTRGYDLTRFHDGPGKPRRVQVHVHRGDSDNSLPEPLRSTWEFAFENRRSLKLVPPEPGTPEGWVPIKVEYPQIRNLYYADPSHDYAVARVVEWSDHDGGKLKFRTESKALRWARLPGGAWYVSAWEVRQHLDKFDASGQPVPSQPDSTSIRPVVITPMEPDRMPPGIFDGEKLLESAREEGAMIQVD